MQQRFLLQILKKITWLPCCYFCLQEIKEHGLLMARNTEIAKATLFEVEGLRTATKMSLLNDMRWDQRIKCRAKSKLITKLKKIKITKYSVFVGRHTINANTITKMVFFQWKKNHEMNRGVRHSLRTQNTCVLLPETREEKNKNTDWNKHHTAHISSTWKALMNPNHNLDFQTWNKI
jgi:hypothetical protein